MLFTALLFLAGYLSSMGAQVVWAEEPPTEVAAKTLIEVFHAHLVDAMQTDSQRQREEILREPIESTFDIRKISSVSLGRTWRKLDEAQRSAFTELLGELVLATYADRFDSYSEQFFETETVTALKSGVVVETWLVKNDGDRVSLNYLLRDNKVFNVLAEGVSDLSLRRADYNSIIKSQGYDSLLEHLAKKVLQARSVTD